MDFQVRYAKVVGTPFGGRDSWVFIKDNLFLVLEIASNSTENSELQALGKEIIDHLTNNFFNLEKKDLKNLKEIVDEVDNQNVFLILGSYTNDVFYLISKGAGRAIIKRNNQYGIILSDIGQVSGKIKDEDSFILTSPRFSEMVSYDELKNVFTYSSPEEIAESLTPLVHRGEDSSGVAALILKFKGRISSKDDLLVPDLKEDFEENNKLEVTLKHSKFPKLKSLFSRFKNPSYQIKEEQIQGKKTVFWVATILIVLLIISVVLGFYKRTNGLKQSRFDQVYNPSIEQYNQAKSLIGVDNNQALGLLNQAEKSLTGIKNDYVQDKNFSQKIDELLKNIKNGTELASQTYKVLPSSFLDLSLIKSGARGGNIDLLGDNLIVIDSSNNSLYQINKDSKSSKIIAGGKDFSGLKSLTVSSNNLFVFADKGIMGEGVEDGSLNNKWSSEVNKDKEWGEIKSISSFGDNLYLLDSGNGKIWKYVGNGSSFLAKTNYLTDSMDLSQADSLGVDGSVWITTGGQIIRFIQGSKDSFNIQGLVNPLGDKLKIVVSPDFKNFYVLDKNNNRVVVFDKTGKYIGQFVWNNLLVVDMVISSDAKQVFLTSGSKIYEFELK